MYEPYFVCLEGRCSVNSVKVWDTGFVLIGIEKLTNVCYGFETLLHLLLAQLA